MNMDDTPPPSHPETQSRPRTLPASSASTHIRAGFTGALAGLATSLVVFLGGTMLSPIFDETDLLPIETRLRTLEAAIGSQDSRLKAVETRPRSPDEQKIRDSVEALRQELEQVKTQHTAPASEQVMLDQTLSTRLDEVSRLASSAEKSASEALGEARTAARQPDFAARSAIALNSLRNRIEQGRSYDSELRTFMDVSGVSSMQVTALNETARSGVPTWKELEQEFHRQRVSLNAAAVEDTPTQTVVDHLKLYLSRLIRISHEADEASETPSARISRIATRLEQKDLESALKEVSALPEKLQVLLADWKTSAMKKHTADQELKALYETTLNGLGTLTGPRPQ